MSAKWAVFLDRDGTINEEVEYLDCLEGLKLISGAAEAIRLLNKAEVPVILVTNQSGIGRGYFTDRTIEEIHNELLDRLARNNAFLDAIYYCPHQPDDGCDCRKPEPGMLLRAAEEHDVDLGQSFIVGDKVSDLAAGHRVGCRTALVLTGHGEKERKAFQFSNFLADYTGTSLKEVVRWILVQQST